MCGIAGILDRRGNISLCDLRTALERMTAALSHRGPDDEGLWIDDQLPVALGHRRLSILDLSPSGHQPMLSRTGRYVITFNGEIYNFKVLRTDLESKGHQFRGTSDTEVMLAAMEEWGVTDSVKYFDGMFAFGVWDHREQVLYLARDRFGEKPLYYSEMGSCFIFGSELRAVECFPGFNSAVSRTALSLLLKYACIPAPHSIYTHVKTLPPASLLRVPANQDQRMTSARYWNPLEVVTNARLRPRTVSTGEIVEELDYLLRKIVKSRMVSDVPIGAFLSGGIDSSTIVAIMCSVSSQPIKAFTVGFAEREYDESLNASAVANHLGVVHVHRTLTAENALHKVPDLLSVCDQPFADASLLPTHLLCEMTRGFVKVALSGDGGDELFGGYNRHVWAASIETWHRRAPAFARELVRYLAARMSSRSIDKVLGVLRHVNQSAFDQRHPVTKARKLAKLLQASETGDLVDQFVSHWDSVAEVIEGGLDHGPLLCSGDYGELTSVTERAMYADLVNYLPNDILTKLDRASMNVSLEARVPYLHEELLKFAWALPIELKIRGHRGKWILRQVLRRYVPDDLVARPKSGFALPIADWLRGPLKEWASDLLQGTSLKENGIFRCDVVGRLWREHLSGSVDHIEQLWPILSFQSWLAARPRVQQRNVFASVQTTANTMES